MTERKVIIGPAMLRAVEYVRNNPGASASQIAASIGPGQNNQVVKRTYNAGLIRREAMRGDDGELRAWRYFVVER